MYAPYDNPEYSIVVMTPNISYENEKEGYTAPINRYISKEVSKLVFEK
jgi:cell division protein FtsI/penicillin-binding protein 2